ncbi:hypothetical protein CBR_g74886 [Chara braunii]|uniref:Uncharacterized protein n=1 Tax=Chara braunii TaxID=69332 RepID=A0A388JJG0_CHABU|nr:hypothetical protein CBR_g74886 [Chara braunii]|eukprot:GBG41723.1 hypothetical protein CBR_g74886 [Chara braunii]
MRRGEKTQFYDGPWKWRSLHRWVHDTQFNPVERITRGNFDTFCKRKLPFVYTLLDEKSEADVDALVSMIRDVALNYSGQFSFVYTPIDEVGDLLDHLRCQYRGASYAVLEDFEDDYRYCVETNPMEKLTVSRLRKLCDGFLSRTATPDHVVSEPIPIANVGPVFKVVGKTLMSTRLHSNGCD